MKLSDYGKPHDVYLFQGRDTSYFKIGMSLNQQRRRVELSTPFELDVVATIKVRDRYQALEVEAGLHALYHHRHLRGEWFHDIPVADFVNAAEWIALGDLKKAKALYGPKSPGRPRKNSDRDAEVLEVLKREGVAAALKVRHQ